MKKALLVGAILLGSMYQLQSMEMVTLKNGAQEHKATVVACFMNIEKIAQENFIAFFDLNEAAKNPNYSYPPCGPGMGGQHSIELLSNYGLTDRKGWITSSTTRNILLSAIEGENLDIKLTSPIEPKAN